MLHFKLSLLALAISSTYAGMLQMVPQAYQQGVPFQQQGYFPQMGPGLPPPGQLPPRNGLFGSFDTGIFSPFYHQQSPMGQPFEYSPQGQWDAPYGGQGQDQMNNNGFGQGQMANGAAGNQWNGMAQGQGQWNGMPQGQGQWNGMPQDQGQWNGMPQGQGQWNGMSQGQNQLNQPLVGNADQKQQNTGSLNMLGDWSSTGNTGQGLPNDLFAQSGGFVQNSQNGSPLQGLNDNTNSLQGNQLQKKK
ncbi:hypothetical protein ACF0H5_006091 [Mactra antiquata]